MNYKRLPISKINAAPYNPRIDLKPDDPRFKALAQSIDAFGVVQPLVVNRRGHVLISGHQRLSVLRARGETEVDVVVVSLSPIKEKALNLALNRVQGAWDKDKLAEVLADLVEAPEIDVELSGFSLPEIDQLLAQAAGGGDPDDEDEPLPDPADVVTKVGEVIQLGLHGEHRIACGDATDSDLIAELMGKEQARLCHTDPPYGVSFDRRRRPKKPDSPAKSRATTKYDSTVRNDDMAPAQYTTWFAKVAASLQASMAPGAPFYIWNSHRNFGLMHDALAATGFKVASVITWEKPSFAPGFGDYNQQTEFCLYGWRTGARHPWYGPKNESTLWKVRRDLTANYRHPTQKALELAERAIRNSSKRDDIVLDPFLGSGTTLIAAARLGRRSFGLELEPRYCDVIVRRYMALAGSSAVPRSVARRYALKEAAR